MHACLGLFSYQQMVNEASDTGGAAIILAFCGPYALESAHLSDVSLISVGLMGVEATLQRSSRMALPSGRRRLDKNVERVALTPRRSHSVT